ncbi:MAG: YggT family protein [Clostridia bacterium]|jgi:YggT family protein|nr:YggT family protein [Clostridia bacterium]
MYLLIDIVDIVFDVMYWLIIIRVILSWVRHDPYNPIFRFIYEVTEIVMGPVRRLVPIRGMGIDFSPIIAILLLQLINSIVVDILQRIIY